MGSGLLEISAKPVNDLRSEWRQQLVPDDLLRSLTYLWDVGRDHDPEGPPAQRTKQRSMAFQEQAELVQPRISDHVDEHAATGEVDADRESFREVPGDGRVALA